MSGVIEKPDTARGVSTPRAAVGVLPGWPLYAAIAGFPLWWALGLSGFSSAILGGVMLFFMLTRPKVALVPGVLSWFAFAVWVLASAVQLQGFLQAIGWVQRFADIVAVGIALLYYVNARPRVTAKRLTGAFVLLWVSMVLLGIAALQFPGLRFPSPVSFLLPGSITSNDLVQQMVFPRLAEVQQPYGVDVPYNRPAAPFLYANSWGAAYAILTPVVLAFLSMRPKPWMRWSLVALLALSVWPAIETSNRGMFLALGFAIAYAAVRIALRGHVLVLVGILVGAGGVGAFLWFSGAIANILGRQQYSDSTGTRSSLYSETFQKTLESPFLGWATPLDDPTIGYALGTQGQAWTLMFSYGFVGLGLFLIFLVGAAVRTFRAPSTAQLWLHSSLVMIIPTMWFYGLGSAQLLAVVLIAGILLRAKHYREAL